MRKKEKFYSIFFKKSQGRGQRPSTLTAVSEIFLLQKIRKGLGEPYQGVPQFLIIYFSVNSTTVSVSSGRGKGFLFLPKAKKVRLG